jgi:replicative DNA helicase
MLTGAPSREPPHSIEAEQQLLGAILVHNDAYHNVAGKLSEEHFFEPEHGKLYGAMARLITRGKPATPLTLKHDFDGPYLGGLAASAVSPAFARDHAELIVELAARRAVIQAATELMERAYTNVMEESAEALIEACETSLAAVGRRGNVDRQVTFSGALTDAIEVVAAAYQRNTGLVGLSTGLRDLDAKLGGLVPSELVVLAGRPGMGKSALAGNIAYAVAASGTPVGFFTVEMSAQQIALRFLAEAARVSSHRMRRGDFSPEAFDKILECAQKIHEAPIYFDETGGISISQLTARARRWKRQRNIGLLVVDYLQLMSGGKRKDASRVWEVSEITASLKALAKDLSIPVLALSQLSRQVENRDDKRPQLADLRESGSIEQDADVVMFIYREDYYLERVAPKEGTPAHAEWENAMAAVSGKAEIIIGKQRHGPTGTVTVQFNPAYTKFNDLAHDVPVPWGAAA